MMKAAHRWGGAAVGLPLAFAAPLAETVGTGPASVGVRIGLVVLATFVGPTPDWDLARYTYRRHPGMMLFRNIAKLMLIVQTQRDRDAWARKREWLERTGKDYDPRDVHRLGTHTVEFAAFWTWFLWWGLGKLSQTAPVAPWVALAVGASLLSHLALDVVTRSGIPVSVLWNLVRHRQAWRMHSLGWVVPDWGGGLSCDVPVLTIASGRPAFTKRRWYPLAKVVVPTSVAADPYDRPKGRRLRAGLLSVGDDVEHYLVVPFLRLIVVVEFLLIAGLWGTVWSAVSPW